MLHVLHMLSLLRMRYWVSVRHVPDMRRLLASVQMLQVRHLLRMPRYERHIPSEMVSVLICFGRCSGVMITD